MLKKIRDWLAYHACCVGFVILPLIPRPLVYPLSRILGRLAWWLDGPNRAVALENLAYAYGDTLPASQRRRIARESLANFALVLLDSFWCRNLRCENIGRYVEFDPAGLSRYDACVARGRGVILIGMHHGNWEWMSLGIGFMKRPVHIAVQPLRLLRVGELFNRIRLRAGHTLILRDGAAVRLFKAVKRGGTLGLLTDLNVHVNDGAIPGRFFGKPIHSNPLPATFARRTGAAILVMTTWYDPALGKYRATFGPEIATEVPGDSETEKIARITQDSMDAFESIIRANPERWLWSYKRWKFRPTPALSSYPSYSQHSALLEKSGAEDTKT
ncbi:MAG: lysophospholipid acyltransferase family protein [Verrucomicrobiae bacterium]|nr:lysophospholipid acyltransferase family protein [Verrucomicrobiae bacterium]